MALSMKKHFRMLGFGGFLCALKAKITNSTALCEVHRDDCAYPFQLRIPSSDVPTYRKIFIDQEYDFVAEAQPRIIVDAGANIGLASIYFANKYPAAKIVAIEPEQSNFELLKTNVAPYPNITPMQAALWHRNEEINMIDSGSGKWGFMAEKKDSREKLRGDICHSVRAMTLDEVMKVCHLKKIDILKIDIEGSEKEVFSSPFLWIERVDSIIIELHERMKAGCNRSFYRATSGFDNEWMQGENIYLSKRNTLTRKAI